jgi:hypothetical protein
MESAATRRNFLASGAAVAIPLSARSAGNNPTTAARAQACCSRNERSSTGAAGAMGSACRASLRAA